MPGFLGCGCAGGSRGERTARPPSASVTGTGSMCDKLPGEALLAPMPPAGTLVGESGGSFGGPRRSLAVKGSVYERLALGAVPGLPTPALAKICDCACSLCAIASEFLPLGEKREGSARGRPSPRSSWHALKGSVCERLAAGAPIWPPPQLPCRSATEPAATTCLALEGGDAEARNCMAPGLTSADEACLRVGLGVTARALLGEMLPRKETCGAGPCAVIVGAG